MGGFFAGVALFVAGLILLAIARHLFKRFCETKTETELRRKWGKADE